MRLPRSIPLSAASSLLPLALSLFPLVASASTWVLRPAPLAPSGTTAEGLLPSEFHGERFCNQTRCVLVASSPSDTAAVTNLRFDPRAHLSPLPDAHKIYYAKSTFDAETGTFEKDFPGATDVDPSSPIGLFAVVFKSYPEEAWLDDFRRAGLSVLEPLPPLAYGVYGSRQTLAVLVASHDYVYATVDIPSGVRRFGLGDGTPVTPDESMATTVVAVAEMADLVKERLMELTGLDPSEVYSTGTQIAFGAELTIQQATDFTRMPEVVWGTRRVNRNALSDERFNKIIAGTWQTPGTAWPTGSTLGCNPPSQPCDPQPPYFWDTYQSYLAEAGIDPAHERIGFLDSGTDDALFDSNGDPACPPHLGTPQDCALIFVTDVTTDFNNLATRGDDHYVHGTMTTSVAAGIHTGETGRDTHGWSFTQGVAPGARVALSRFFPSCEPLVSNPNDPNYGGRRGYGGTLLWDVGINGLKYSLAELGSSSTLPDFPENPKPSGPGVRLFNHSHNNYYHTGGSDPANYGDESILLDQATRSLIYAQFALDYEGEALFIHGDQAQSLHVVSAGNYPGPSGDYSAGERTVIEPANAKNVIAVGATSSLNDESYDLGASCANNGSTHAVDAHNIEGFSRNGYSNERLKPDLVAPATRAYGRNTTRRSDSNCTASCNFNLLENQADEFAWYWGTSFAAPVVTGAAALVHDWYRVLTDNVNANASPALVKAALIASATNLKDSVLPMGFYFTAGDSQDLTPSAISLTPGDVYFIRIDGLNVGSPPADTFQWQKNGGPFTNGVRITGSFQALGNDIEVRFAQTTGHIAYSYWEFKYDCSWLRPTPDAFQGWGGVSLDRLFRESDHYYFYDQGTTLHPNSSSWTATLAIKDTDEPVSVALVWTDRASGSVVNSSLNLINDLNLVVHVGEHIYVGNNYYAPSSPCDSSRDGYSLQYDENSEWDYDAKNNVERVDIDPALLENESELVVEVSVGNLSGDGIVPQCFGSCQHQQDFAVFVVNAHE